MTAFLTTFYLVYLTRMAFNLFVFRTSLMLQRSLWMSCWIGGQRKRESTVCVPYNAAPYKSFMLSDAFSVLGGSRFCNGLSWELCLFPRSCTDHMFNGHL